VTAGEKLRIALFGDVMGATWSQALLQGGQAWAKAHCASITVFDGQENPTLKAQQFQNALTTGDYNAWFVTPSAGVQQCDALTKQAPAHNILVVVSSDSVCGKDTSPLADQWTAGSLSYVDATSTVTYMTGWLEEVAKQLGAGSWNVIIANGPSIISLSKNITQAATTVESQYPNIKVVANLQTDLTTPTTQTMVAAALNAHPNANVIISAYTPSTVGAINAVKQAGMASKVKVYDIGGAKENTPLIQNGSQTGTVPYFPYSDGQEGFAALGDAFLNGTVPARVIPAVPVGTPTQPLLVTASNLSQFQPQY
jgi:ABC-type sugar transport system substrate-binding protein